MAIQTVFLAENTTAYATDVMNLVDPLYTDLDGSNVSDKTGTGTTLVLSANPTFTGSVSLNSGADFKIYSDAGSTLKFFVDGATGDFGIPPGAKFYLDSATLVGDTYFTNNAVDGIIEAYSNAVRSFTILNTGVGIPATNQFFLDGVSQAGNTSIRESSSDVVTVKAGGVDTFAISATGVSVTGTLGVSGAATVGTTLGVTGIATFSSEVLLPNVDPPTANYANRNGIVKAWLKSDGSGNILGSYNISSVSSPGTGRYSIVWDTNFSTNAHPTVVSPAVGGGSHTAGIFSSTITPPDELSIEVRTYDSTPALDNTTLYLISIGDQL